MSASIPDTPEKTKRTPLQDDYNRHICFALIFAAFAVMLLYRADDLIGAVLLRQYFMVGAMVSAVIAAFSGVELLRRWGEIAPSTGLIVVIILIFGLITALPFVFLISGWFTWQLALSVSPVVPAAGAIITLIAWIMGGWLRYFEVRPAYLKAVTFMVLIVTPFYLQGIVTAKPSFAVIQSETMSNHIYTLALRQGQGDHPEAPTLELYFCNQYAFSCQRLYQSPLPDYYDYRPDMRLVPDEPGGIISVVVDGKTVERFQTHG